jgi:hypothetical protein
MDDQYDGIRYLGAGECRFSRNALGQLCAALTDGTELKDVLVYRTCPVTAPNRYISVRIGATQSEQREVGLIRNLNALAPDQRHLITEELARRYFIHIITRIHTIREELGYLYWDCATDKGDRQFAVPRWDQRAVLRATEGCRVITDVDGTRYEIRDIDKLDMASQAVFNRYIYW